MALTGAVGDARIEQGKFWERHGVIQAWQMVRHAMSLILNNLGPSLRVTIGPALIAFVTLSILTTFTLGTVRIFFHAVSGDFSPAFFATFLAFFFASAAILIMFGWAAIGWHRYVLLEEAPGLFPAFRDRPIGGYIWKSIVIGVILILIAIPLMFVLNLILAPFVFTGTSGGSLGAAIIGVFVMGLIVSTILGYFGLRMALVLPALAVGKPIAIGDSFAATQPISGQLFWVAAILSLINYVPSLIFDSAVGQNIVALVLSFAVAWFTTLLGISILTTLYGHLIEGRPLR